MITLVRLIPFPAKVARKSGQCTRARATSSRSFLKTSARFCTESSSSSFFFRNFWAANLKQSVVNQRK